MGLAVGVEKMGKAGLLGGAGRSGRDRKVYEPAGRYGSVMSVEGVLGTGTMPGVFAQAGMDYARQHDGVGPKQFAAVAEKNHAHSTLNPLAQYQAAYSLEQEGSAIKVQVQIAIGGGNDAVDTLNRASGRGDLLRDRSRRLSQDARELKRDRDR